MASVCESTHTDAILCNKYAQAFEGNFVEQNFLSEKIKNQRLYNPQNNPTEIKILECLKRWWGQRF